MTSALTTADLDARERLCRDLLAAAGSSALESYSRLGGMTFSMKGPQDFVTEADDKIEEMIRSAIADSFPEDGFLGEEGGGRPSSRIWVVDPIDGTANFMRGIPHFCTSIALVDNGRVVLGGLACPALGETYFARRGQGAWRNADRLHVAGTDAFDRCTIEFGWSTRTHRLAYLDRVATLLELGVNVKRCGSGALGLAYVADGRADGYGELHINSWDCLAGILLVEEAGGVCNDFLSGNGLMQGNPILAAAPGVASGLSRATGIPLSQHSNR